MTIVNYVVWYLGSILQDFEHIELLFHLLNIRSFCLLCFLFIISVFFFHFHLLFSFLTIPAQSSYFLTLISRLEGNGEIDTQT